MTYVSVLVEEGNRLLLLILDDLGHLHNGVVVHVAAATGGGISSSAILRAVSRLDRGRRAIKAQSPRTIDQRNDGVSLARRIGCLLVVVGIGHVVDVRVLMNVWA